MNCSAKDILFSDNLKPNYSRWLESIYNKNSKMPTLEEAFIKQVIIIKERINDSPSISQLYNERNGSLY